MRRRVRDVPRPYSENVMKLCLALPSLFVLALGAAGCSALGSYSGMMAQPGAQGAAPGATGAGAPSAANPTTPGSTSSESASASSSSSPVSVNIRSSCGQTVKVFFGDKPKFGSGTYSTASSNSVSSHSFKSGELFWIVDESENGVASVTVKDGTHEIEILGSCHELAAR